MNKDAQGRRKVERSESNWKCGFSTRVYRPERGKELPEALRSQPTKIQGDGALGTVGAECLSRSSVFTLDATQRADLLNDSPGQSTPKW